MKREAINIKGNVLSYYDEPHIYLCDGVILPSITQIVRTRFADKYKDVDKAVLKRAADKGTAVHEAIEAYCRYGTESELPEVRGYKWLSYQHGFECIANESMLMLFDGEKPIAAGRCDMVLKQGEEYCGADIKRTAALDKEYTAYQLNLYRIAFRQSFGIEWTKIYALHLRGETRKLVQLPINEAAAWELVKEFKERTKEDEQDTPDWSADERA